MSTKLRWIAALSAVVVVIARIAFGIPEPPPPDSDGDGLPDVWEMKYFGNLGQSPNGDPDGDGLTNLQEYQLSSNPTDYYNAVLPLQCLVNDSDQVFARSSFIVVPLNVQASATNGLFLTNAPLVFAVSNGAAQLSVTTNGTLSSTLSLRTDNAGRAAAWIFMPTNSSATNLIVVTATSETNKIQMQFAASVLNPAGTTYSVQLFSLAPPNPFTPAVNLYWQNYDYRKNCSGGSGSGPKNAYELLSNGALGLVIVRGTNNTGTLIVTNSEADMTYEILSKPTLAATNWISEGFVLGAEGQNWTSTDILLTKTNNKFFWARSYVDSDGSGLPDWWQLQYFGHLGVNLYGDPDGDGVSNIEEFYDGTNPMQFYMPAAPRNARVHVNHPNLTATISWQIPSSRVLSNTIYRWNDDTWEYDPLAIGPTNIFEDVNFIYNDYAGLVQPPDYWIVAHYPEGDSRWVYADYDHPDRYDEIPEAFTIAGQGGSTIMVVKNIPANASFIRISALHGYNTIQTNWDVPASLFTNVFYTLPSYMTSSLYDYYYIQAVFGDGLASPMWWAGPPSRPFYDGRKQMRENLAFVLRGAGLSQPMHLNLAFYYGRYNSYADYPTNYAYSGLDGAALFDSEGIFTWKFQANLGYPFEDNYLYRNFVQYSASDMASDGGLTTGFSPEFSLNNPRSYVFNFPTNTTSILSVLAADQTTWMLPTTDRQYLGITTNSTYFFQSNASNWFGLPLTSVLIGRNAGSSPQFLTLALDAPVYRSNGVHYFYPNFEQPVLQTVDYLFTGFSLNLTYERQPGIRRVPGDSQFSPTDPPYPVTLVVGEPESIAAFAKQRILNGDSSKPAYLGQYFEKAYKVANGDVTSTETGFISEYGDFFPTEPGAVALVTMTNWGVNERGTNIAYVISLTTDVNRDGIIDTSYTGPDALVWGDGDAFNFWVNDDNDSGETSGNDIPGSKTPDGLKSGTSVRDLIDFFPVYLNIQSLLQAAPTNFPFTCYLKQEDGALNYFEPTWYMNTVLGPTNCMAYLTDTNVVRQIVSLSYPYSPPKIQVTSAGVHLPNSFVDAIRDNGKGILLIEARTATSRPLILEVRQGTNVIAKAQLPLSISSVEQMFRHKNLNLVIDSNGLPEGPRDRLTKEAVRNEPPTNDKNFVFLHGYNVNPEKARGTFAEMFKRMYWSGSHAKFYGVTWRGYESQLAGSVTPNLQTNVVNAFLTAPMLKDFLATLTNDTVAAAHSLGNMVVLSALSDWNANIKKFFMLDAAVALEAIDGNMSVNTNMVHPNWFLYTNRLYASRWFNLFINTDYRSTLSWNGRLSNLPITNIYNFYSSGEEVLREHVGSPPDVTGAVFDQVVLNGIFGANPVGTYTWAWQEKMKGRCAGNWILGSSHGGWRFSPSTNYYTNFFYQDGWVTNRLGPSEVANVPDAQLQTNAFFDFNSGGNQPFTADSALYGTSASTYAQTNRNRILADAIPALTLPVGANPVGLLSPDGEPTRNFNMQALYENGWPSSRTGDEAEKWHHSDFREVAYIFTWPLFNKFVNEGNLK